MLSEWFLLSFFPFWLLIRSWSDAVAVVLIVIDYGYLQMGFYRINLPMNIESRKRNNNTKKKQNNSAHCTQQIKNNNEQDATEYRISKEKKKQNNSASQLCAKNEVNESCALKGQYLVFGFEPSRQTRFCVTLRSTNYLIVVI